MGADLDPIPGDRDDPDEVGLEPSPAPDVIASLVANHRQFLSFVERRVGDRALAEDILQAAFVRGLDKADEIHSSSIGWFYGVLRNAVIDHQRRAQSEARRLDRLAAELDEAVQPSVELHEAVCRCVSQLAGTLRPEYADALRRIDVEGTPVKDYAAAVGITSNNAGVRVFRAREALRKQVARSCGTCAEHGCYQCTCGQRPAVD